MEYALPRAHAVSAVQAVRQIIEHNDFSVPLPIEVRFVAGDDAFLSPAHGRETCYLAVHMFEGMEWAGFFRSVEAAMSTWGDGRTGANATFKTRQVCRRFTRSGTASPRCGHVSTR
jgi:hypothetical protein